MRLSKARSLVIIMTMMQELNLEKRTDGDENKPEAKVYV